MNYLATRKSGAESQQMTGIFGHYSYSYKQDIYSQVLVIPDFINAGNVSQTQNYTITLWNTTENELPLDSILEIGTEGMLLNGNAAGNLDSNEFRQYDLEISSQGPSVVDAKYIFNLGTYSRELKIVGSRVILFDFDINWRQLPKESFSHYTDVRISYDGTEYRHNLTENPRMLLQYYYTLTDEERMRLDGYLYAWADKVFLVPIYSQLTNLISSVNSGTANADVNITNTDIQSGMSILFKDKEKQQIMNVKSIFGNTLTFENNFEHDFDVNCFIIPLCQAFIGSQSRTSHQTDNLTEMVATFDIQDNTMLTITNNIDGFKEYNGLKLLTQEPNRRITINRAYARLVDVVDYGSGVRKRISKDKKPAMVFNYTFDCIGKDEINKTKAFFNNMKGMTDEFLVSTFTSDIKLAKPVLSTETTLVIENTGVGTFYLNNEQKSLILFRLNDGTEIVRKVINVLYNSETKESLIIDEPLGLDLNSDAVSIQFLSNARFNADTIEFEYETDEYARATTEIRVLRG